MTELLGICDYFLICTATSSTQADTIIDELEKRARELGLKAGLRASRSPEWTLLDFGDIIVHVFSEEAREFYRLEMLWKDAPRLSFEKEAAR
jgi:ribosome-associated protein